MQNAAHTYFQTQFSTMGQGEVLILLYDGALKFLALAKEKIALKDYGAKGIAISRALDIINELDSTLNLEAGGELSQNLHQLYFICSTRLLRANLKMDTAVIDGVMDVLIGLRSAYAEIVNRPEAQAASEQIAAKRKSFDVKGRATTTPETRPLQVGGGGRAQAAYSTVAGMQPVAATLPAGDLPHAANTAASIPPQPVLTEMPPKPAMPQGATRSASVAAYGRMAQYGG